MPINTPGDDARKKLLALERRRQFAVVLEFEKIQKRLTGEISELLQRIDKQRRIDGNASPGLLIQKARLTEILDALTAEIRSSSTKLGRIVETAQTSAVDVAKQQAIQTNVAELTANIGFFDGPATAELIGIAGDGSPLAKHFAKLAAPARQGMFDALFFGLATGKGNDAIAREIQDAIGAGRLQAMTITRTETNRAYREASRKFYDDTPGVIGWRWLAALDLRTCPICWGLHGRVFKTKTKFGTHPNCRCTMVPVFEGDTKAETGPQIFARLTDPERKTILGPRRFDLYTQGAELADFYENHKTPFGISRRIKPLINTTFKIKPRPPAPPFPDSIRELPPSPAPIKEKAAATPKPALPGNFTAADAQSERLDFMSAVGPQYLGFDDTRATLKTAQEKAFKGLDDAFRISFDDPGRAAQIAEAREAQRLANAALNEFLAKERELMAADRARLYTKNPMQLDGIFTGKQKFTKAETELVNKTVGEFNKLVDASAWSNENKKIGINKRKGRAYYLRAQIYINPVEGGQRTIVHEIGHGLEKFNPDILKQANEFLDYRTAGEKAVKLKKLYPGYRYAASEIARPDKFSNAYIGKVYGPVGNQDYTEVISMGIEQMYSEPYKMAVEDPEYFEFILTVIRGGKWQPLK